MDPMEFQEVGVGKDKRFYLAHDVLQTNKQEAQEIKRRQDGSLDCRSKFFRESNIINGVHCTKNGLPNKSYNENIQYKMDCLRATSVFGCFGGSIN